MRVLFWFLLLAGVLFAPTAEQAAVIESPSAAIEDGRLRRPGLGEAELPAPLTGWQPTSMISA